MVLALWLVIMALGIGFCGMGYLIGKKQMIGLIHSYHYKNVKEENKQAFTREAGKGLISMGIGISLFSIFMILLPRNEWVLVLGIGLFIGLFLILKAVKKYNGSIL